jgi:hypothetical protein
MFDPTGKHLSADDLWGVLDARVRTREAIEAVRRSGPQALQGPFKPRESAA